jgi:hypothetical protein
LGAGGVVVVAVRIADATVIKRRCAIPDAVAIPSTRGVVVVGVIVADATVILG